MAASNLLYPSLNNLTLIILNTSKNTTNRYFLSQQLVHRTNFSRHHNIKPKPPIWSEDPYFKYFILGNVSLTQPAADPTLCSHLHPPYKQCPLHLRQYPDLRKSHHRVQSIYLSKSTYLFLCVQYYCSFKVEIQVYILTL